MTNTSDETKIDLERVIYEVLGVVAVLFLGLCFSVVFGSLLLGLLVAAVIGGGMKAFFYFLVR